MRRVVSFGFWRRDGWKLALTVGVAAVLFAAGVIWRGEHTPVCATSNALNDAIVASVDRTRLALPSNPYFKAHPGQLQAQLDDLQKTRDDLRSARC